MGTVERAAAGNAGAGIGNEPGMDDGCDVVVEQVVDDAVLVWVVHDVNPHALSPKVKSFVQAQHWFQDLTTIGPQ